MKKLLCVLLALTIVCAFFAGCAKEETPAETSPSAGASAAPSESAQPEASAEPEPESKSVLAVHMTLSDTFWQSADELLATGFEAIDIKYDSISGEGDPVKQMEQIENGVVQGYDLIIVIPLSGEAVADACKAAMDAGVYIYCFINDSIYHTVYRTTDAAYSGQVHVQYAAEWALEHFPDAEDGSINVVLMGQNTDTHTTARWEAMQEEAAKYPQFNIIDAIVIEESVMDGQAKAETILTMHPDTEIHLWICGTGPVAIGVNAAIMAENSGVDYKSDVCVSGNSINEEIAALIHASETDESVLRMCAAIGGNFKANMSQIVTQCAALLNGEKVDDFSPVNVDYVGVDNLADFGY